MTKNKYICCSCGRKIIQRKMRIFEGNPLMWTHVGKGECNGIILQGYDGYGQDDRM
jgi:hypothetical protein